jgi:hypothetical protein
MSSGTIGRSAGIAIGEKRRSISRSNRLRMRTDGTSRSSPGSPMSVSPPGFSIRWMSSMAIAPPAPQRST